MNEAVFKLLVLWPVYIVYMILGALIFMELEQENERTLVNRFIKRFEEFNATKHFPDEFMNNLSHLYQDAFALGINPHDIKYQSKWDFAGSFYFVGTVLTTIGFGLTSPTTVAGQASFLIYALLGIPLNILLFNTLLDQTVHLFTWILTSIYRKWQRKHAVMNFNHNARSENTLSNWEPTTAHIAIACFITVIIVILVSAPLFVYLDNWSFFESVYFSVVAFTTVGFGDFVPGGVHSKHGDNLTPHYKVGNWFIIIIGTVFMYTSLALLASLYKHCLENAISTCRKRMKRTAGLNRITASPQVSSTPAHDRARAPSISPMKDERKREMAARALQNWRGVKKQSIGPLSQVEASLSKRRRTKNEDGLSQTCEAISFLRLDDNRSSLHSKIKGQTDTEELNAMEAKLTREFNQIIEHIQQKRESLAKRTISHVSCGIDNGVAIALSSPESICTPPLTTKTDVDEASIVSNHSYN